jgi:hypothetical protein
MIAMNTAFEDDALGLRLKGYALVPNEFLETKIGIYTSEIVEAILQEHPQIVDKWLKRLHLEYISKKKQCDFDNDPVACFTLSAYEHYEKNFLSWDNGGLIAITLPRGKVIRVSKRPLITVATGGTYSCTKCMTSFTDLDEYQKHLREEEVKVKTRPKDVGPYDQVPMNTVGWLSP